MSSVENTRICNEYLLIGEIAMNLQIDPEVQQQQQTIQIFR